MALPGVVVVTGAMRPPSATVVTVVPAVMVAQVWGTSTPVLAGPAVTAVAVVPTSAMAVMVAPAVEVALALTASLARCGPGLMAVPARRVETAVRAVAEAPR